MKHPALGDTLNGTLRWELAMREVLRRGLHALLWIAGIMTAILLVVAAIFVVAAVLLPMGLILLLNRFFLARRRAQNPPAPFIPCPSGASPTVPRRSKHPARLVDLHAHYAMHLLPEYYSKPGSLLKFVWRPPGPGEAREEQQNQALVQLRSCPGADGLRATNRAAALAHINDLSRSQVQNAPWRARLLGLANLAMNFRSLYSGPGVTIDLMRAGGVGVALSVVHDPFDEILHSGSEYPPDDYFKNILWHMGIVESHVQDFASQAVVVHNWTELRQARKAGKIALIHCVEGGYHVGGDGDIEQIRRNVQCLAQSGVAYLTLAHLAYRGIAENAPAIPQVSDPLYHAFFPKPRQALSSLGEAAVRAMAENGILVDVTHMSQAAIDRVFEVLEAHDTRTKRKTPTPVIAGHMACRFNRGREYNLSPDTIERIAKRGGVMGVIFCEHWIRQGIPKPKPRSLRESFAMMRAHIDQVGNLTGSDKYVAIGSDLDGFIKPALSGLDDMARMRELEECLIACYGERTARRITWYNPLRVLRCVWGRALVGAADAPGIPVAEPEEP